MNVDIDISNVVLTTKRLVLRPWRYDDLIDFYEYAKVDGVGQMAGWLPHESIDQTKEILDHFIQEKKTFAIEYHGKVIGSLGIETYDETKYPDFKYQKAREIGYVLSKAYWGQGLMPEAVKRVIQYLFEQVHLDLIFCGHFVSNRQSARVQQKCGFHHYKNDLYTTRMGTVEDHIQNLITYDDYLWIKDQY